MAGFKPPQQRKKPHIPNFSVVAKGLRRNAYADAKALLKTFANTECIRFKQKIRAQGFPSFQAVPLSPRYLAFKRRKGLDLRVMIATGYYVEQIKVFEEPIPGGIKGVRFRVGFRDGQRAKNSKGGLASITLGYLGLVHEYGSSNGHVPSRPHWRPFFQDMLKRSVNVRKQIALIGYRVVKAIQKAQKREV